MHLSARDGAASAALTPSWHRLVLNAVIPRVRRFVIVISPQDFARDTARKGVAGCAAQVLVPAIGTRADKANISCGHVHGAIFKSFSHRLYRPG